MKEKKLFSGVLLKVLMYSFWGWIGFVIFLLIEGMDEVFFSVGLTGLMVFFWVFVAIIGIKWVWWVLNDTSGIAIHPLFPKKEEKKNKETE